jgi:hypothetical protein
LIFQHDPFVDLGLFAEILEREKLNYRLVRLFDGAMPAEDWRDVAALIVLGGPMSVADEEAFPFLRWEKRIIGPGAGRIDEHDKQPDYRLKLHRKESLRVFAAGQFAAS